VVELVRELRGDESPGAVPDGIRIVELSDNYLSGAYDVFAEGVADSPKQAQIAWAAERGFRRLFTDTAWANESTLRLNESQGYRPLPPVFAVRTQLA
jgi:hypothetical protein